ncbi:MAG: DUF434 domain-containing protein [Bacteroidota bacterium]
MTQRNRGKQSSDDQWFAHKWHPILTEACNDLGYLLSRGYAAPSALQLVGNRYRLNKRQRQAITRISASQQAISKRQAALCPLESVKGKVVDIDGFNLLILLESALSGAYLFKARDGTYRDISSVHGSYKRVQQTEAAIQLIGQTLLAFEAKAVNWYLDQPISNSGRLKTRLLAISREQGFPWDVFLVYGPDQVLAKSEHFVLTADGWILEQAKAWINLSAYLIENQLLQANVIVV